LRSLDLAVVASFLIISYTKKAMSVTSAYWVPPMDQEYQVQTTNHKKGDLGFRVNIPWPLPVSYGAGYAGEGREELYLKKELNTSTQTEYFPRGGNVIPATGGKPLVNIYKDEFKFTRKSTAVPFKE
jgi:hypothetical protein